MLFLVTRYFSVIVLRTMRLLVLIREVSIHFVYHFDTINVITPNKIIFLHYEFYYTVIHIAHFSIFFFFFIQETDMVHLPKYDIEQIEEETRRNIENVKNIIVSRITVKT